jgi:endonuclease YncB( thermonuclease family)
MLARCYTHGEDLNRWTVASGWAMARRQLTADYSQAEAVAHDRHLGMWRGGFFLPSQWQMARR